jgi:hypothetical protein
MTWAIDPARSLFYYESSDNATFYSFQNLHYRPTFNEPTAGPLEVSARKICNIPPDSANSSQWSPVQRTCYYDISVTGDLVFGRVSREAAEQQVEQREAMRNPPRFNPNLSLTQSVRVGQQVSISFQATSEFNSSVAYKLIHGPTETSFDETTGQFEWKVPGDMVVGSKVPVKVSAQDVVYNLTSTYEVVLEVQQKSNARSFTTSVLLLLFALASGIVFE